MDNDFFPEQESTKKETDRKCPQCGATMDFDPSTGGLFCSYCEYREVIVSENKDNKTTAEEIDLFSETKTENCNWGAKTKTILCKSCGAESIYDELELANICPYCGSNHVMEENDVNTLAPGGVVPFSITIKQATESFKNWIKGKLFCPSKAKKTAKAESFKGVYLPYWTFDSSTETSYYAKYGKDRVVRDRKGNTRIHTTWYSTSGTYHKQIDDELVLGSTRHDEAMLCNLEPFNTKDNKAYKPEYISGFTAERYSLGLKDAWEKAKRFIYSKIESAISHKVKSEHHADHVRIVNMNVVHKKVTYKYLLLPIWLSSFKYKDKIYSFMVNGQTGKTSGKTPISPIRVTIAVMLVILVIVLIAYLYSNS